MTATDAPEFEAIARCWGHAYTLSHDPDQYPDKPYAAHRKNGTGSVRAENPDGLLDAIKDDARLFTGDAA